MAEITSGTLTVLVLDEEETAALARALMVLTGDGGGGARVDEGPLFEILDALCPTEVDA